MYLYASLKDDKEFNGYRATGNSTGSTLWSRELKDEIRGLSVVTG
jgi:hypothetical protein